MNKIAAGQEIVNNGRLIILDRTFNSSPTRTAPSQFSVGTGTTTPTKSDTGIETVIAINGGNLKNFATGFPTLDTTNFQATIRCFLNTAEANGNTLTELGLFNADGTPVMFSHAVHTALSKTSSIETTYIEKDRIV